eukprot:3048664-Amphidinium_carterae.1
MPMWRNTAATHIKQEVSPHSKAEGQCEKSQLTSWCSTTAEAAPPYGPIPGKANEYKDRASRKG